MPLRLSKTIWITMSVGALLPGIGAGVGLAQEHWTAFGSLLGWMIFPMGVVQFLTRSFADDYARITWLISLVYPLTMFVYSVFAYWAMQQGMKKGGALLFVVIAAFISTVASIPAAMIAMYIIQQLTMPLWNQIIGYIPALTMHGLILINLLISALLGWAIGQAVFTLRHRKSRPVVSLEA